MPHDGSTARKSLPDGEAAFRSRIRSVVLCRVGVGASLGHLHRTHCHFLHGSLLHDSRKHRRAQNLHPGDSHAPRSHPIHRVVHGFRGVDEIALVLKAVV